MWPNLSMQISYHSCPDVCPGACPGACPDACPGACPGVCPGACPDVCPGACPGACSDVCSSGHILGTPTEHCPPYSVLCLAYLCWVGGAMRPLMWFSILFKYSIYQILWIQSIIIFCLQFYLFQCACRAQYIERKVNNVSNWLNKGYFHNKCISR